MTSLLKLVQTSRTFSMIFDFRIKDSKNVLLFVISIIIKAILLSTIGLFMLLLQVFLYFLYLNMFFTSLPGTLVKKIRMESLGYDPSNKWLFNISYLMLYLFVLIFEFGYIFTNYLVVICSFVMDCLMWVLTLGKTKLSNTDLSLSDKNLTNSSVNNFDIFAIILTFASFPIFYLLGEMIIATDIYYDTWLLLSFIVAGLNTLFYMLLYFPKLDPTTKLQKENKAVSDK